MANNDALIIRSGEFSVGYEAESTFAENSNGSETWLDVMAVDPPSWEVALTDEARSAGQRGAMLAPFVGAKVGSWTLRLPSHGQSGSFTTANDGPPMDVGLWALVENALGGESHGIFASGTIAGTPDANTVNHQSGSGLAVGLAFAYGNQNNDILGMGFVESTSSTTASLAFDMRAAPSAGDNVYPMRTLYPGTIQPTSHSWRLVGSGSAADYRYSGGMPSSLTFTFDESDYLFVDYAFQLYGGRAQGSSGGIQSVTYFEPLGRLNGVDRARIVLGHNTFTTYDDGTADANGVCGVTDISITVNFPHSPYKCHSKTEKVGACVVGSPTCEVSFTAYATSDFDDSGENIFWTVFNSNGATYLPFAIQAGKQVGQLFQFFIPKGHVSVVPSGQVTDDIWSYQVTVRAGVNDTMSDTGIGNKPFYFAIG